MGKTGFAASAGFAVFACFVGFAGTTLFSPEARGAGFGLNENSARVMGMGGAFTAIANSPAAIFCNPAGLATLDGLQLEAGVTMVAPFATYRGLVPGTATEVTVDATKNLFWLPSLHASYRIHDRVAAGLGIYVPYGLTMEWPNEVDVNGQSVGWWGRGVIKKISLQTIYINPTVAVNLHKRIQLGAGVTIIKAAVGLEKAVTASASPADDVDVKLSGGDVSVGATAGVLVNVIPDLLNVGLAFRSGASFTFSGNAAFTKGGDPAAVPLGLRTQLVDGRVEADLSLPHVFSFGIAAFPLASLTIGFALDVITWSAYNKLAVRFLDTPALSSTEPKDWKNTLAVRIGAEYFVLPKLPLRIGFIFDQGPTPSTTLGPDLPDGDRYEFTLGAGYKLWGFSVDLAYQFLLTGDLKTADSAPIQGTYTTTAHLLGLSLGYTLDI
jgi:long-chain fatty acid transport protein